MAASMVARWRQEYETRGEAAFAPSEPTPAQALEAKVAELMGLEVTEDNMLEAAYSPQESLE